MNNPKTIEITGYKTIVGLCKFGADSGMEGYSFTEIVEKLLGEHKKLQAQLEADKWISVKDRLPTKNGIYVLFRPDAWDEPYCDPRISCRKFVDGKWQGLHEVTHWQPLPKPPKELTK